MKIAVVIQARTGSSRLPGKVLLPLAGQPLLVRVAERVLAASTPCEVIVATTTMPDDEPVRELCRTVGVRCASGHPTDLLDRHLQAARECGADAVVKIPSDCPLVDPGVIDRVLQHFLQHLREYDYVSNLHPATYPDGNDVEIMPEAVLAIAGREASRDFEREHTTPFLWDHPERFRIGNVAWETGLDFSMTHRWTIDYPEDYQFLSRIYDELWTATRPVFRIGDILDLLREQPDIASINARYAGVNWYRNHLDVLSTITPAQTRGIDTLSLP